MFSYIFKGRYFGLFCSINVGFKSDEMAGRASRRRIAELPRRYNAEVGVKGTVK